MNIMITFGIIIQYPLTMKTIQYISAAAILLAFFTAGCDKPDNDVLPQVTTAEISGITLNSVQCGGNVITEGGSKVESRGICWDTIPNPVVTGKCLAQGKGTGAFACQLTALKTNTIYYLRAFATNKAGTAYGENMICCTDFKDIDGNVYNAITIGEQVWMRENLKTTKFRDSTSLTGYWNDHYSAYKWFQNAISWKDTFGGFYNFNAIKNAAGLCPLGWSMPDDDDWAQLLEFLGGDSIAGGKMKEAGVMHWNLPNTDATNESGFTGLPAGSTVGNFSGFAYNAIWWSRTEEPFYPYETRVVILSTNSGSVTRQVYNKNEGCTVRCIKD